MTRIVTLLSLAVLALAALATPSRAAQPGNIDDEVNHNAVLDGQVRVCDLSTHMSAGLDAHAVLQWNEAIGAAILTVDCSTTGGYRGVTITDVQAGDCGYDTSNPPKPKPACASFPPDQNRVDLGQWWTPVPTTDEYTPAQKQTIAVHELGHNLGFKHYLGDSIMDDRGSPFGPYRYTEPQPIDITNYHTAYIPPAPTVSGSAGAPGQVQLSWTDNSWNEESFAIYRDNVWVAVAARNTSSLLLTSQPPGSHLYKMGGFTRADCFGTGGFCAAGNEVPVTVAGTVRLRGVRLLAEALATVGYDHLRRVRFDSVHRLGPK